MRIAPYILDNVDYTSSTPEMAEGKGTLQIQIYTAANNELPNYFLDGSWVRLHKTAN